MGKIRETARTKLAEQWNKEGETKMFELVGPTSFSVSELQTYQDAFRGIYRKSKQGINRELFEQVMQMSAPHLVR